MIAAMFAVLVSAAAPSFAHHAFSLDFDKDKPLTLSGTVTRVVWANPHVLTYLDVKDDKGKVANWKVEMGSPEALTKAGWTRTTLKTGQMVTLQGWQAKDGTHFANAEEMTMPDGRKLSGASSYDTNAALARKSGEKGTAATSGAQKPKTTDKKY